MLRIIIILLLLITPLSGYAQTYNNNGKEESLNENNISNGRSVTSRSRKPKGTLGINSACPICNQYNDFFSSFANKYNVQVSFNDQTFAYQIELVTRPDTHVGLFNYNVSVINNSGSRATIAQNLYGFLSFNVISFALPGRTTSIIGTSNVLPEGSLSCFAAGQNPNSFSGTCDQLLGVLDNLSAVAGSSFAQVTLTPVLN